MQAFLFDANHVTAFERQDSRITEKLRAEPAERNYIISKITRGELEAGHRMGNPDPTELAKFWQFVEEKFFTLIPRENEAIELSRKYGEIIGRLHAKYPKKSTQNTEQWLQSIGVQVNDVWLVAEAWCFRMVCVTHDNMEKIKEVLEQEILQREVRFDDWLL